jgi:pimeloyl-ACP methyl ester carboxylesterase
VTFPIAAPEGHFAAMSSHDAIDYTAFTPPHWRNEMTARVMLHLATYRPISKVRQLKKPLLIQACMKDTVAPAQAALKLARRGAPLVELQQYPIGHFEIYGEKYRDIVLAHQLDFFRRHLDSGVKTCLRSASTGEPSAGAQRSTAPSTIKKPGDSV